MSNLQKLWLAEFIFGEKGTLQTFIMLESGMMEVKFVDNGGNHHHVGISKRGFLKTFDL